jgi:glucosylceramidase
MIKYNAQSIRRWFVLVLMAGLVSCSKKGSSGGGTENPPPPPPPPPPVTSDVSYWLTRADRTALLQKQNAVLAFSGAASQLQSIIVDSTQKFQSMEGFGYTLTGGSAQVIQGLPTATKDALLRQLFSNDANAIGVSYLRISIGASDLNESVFTYNDLPSGQTDVDLANFDLGPDKMQLIPLLKQIVAIQPSIKILATPWTAPVWMKTNTHSVGGRLKPEYFQVYANYFVKYIQSMKAEGITIDAITPQNEPLNPHNNPSMEMSSIEQANFIKNNLGPALKAAGLSTKIIIYDHNADRPEYPIAILNDADAKQYIDGSAFHLYGGDIGALSQVRNAHPDKNIYFTEQYTSSTGSFGGDLAWHIKNLIVGATRNWSKNVLEWNLANNPSIGPYTPGGCSVCLGALTIGNDVTRNVAYYIIAHASKFVPPGSIRIASNIINNLHNVAFLTPDGKKVLIVLNENNTSQTFNIQFKDKRVATILDAGAVATYVW